MAKKQKVCKDQDAAYRPYDREESKKRKRNSYGKLNSFSWSNAEEFLYVEFLKNNKNLFIDVKQRKKSKVFVVMSDYVKKRGPDQCRSHHQKMSIKYGIIDSIIEKITEEKINRVAKVCPQVNSTTSVKMIENSEKQEFENGIQNEDNKSQSEQTSEISNIQMKNFSQQEVLWDYLNEDVWINA